MLCGTRRFRAARLPLAVAAAIVLAALSGCGSDSGGGPPVVYEDNGVRFAYPADWDEVELNLTLTANVLWDLHVGPGNPTIFVSVSAYSVPVPVTTDNLNLYRESLAGFFQENAEANDSTLRGGLVRTAVAGLPGYRYRVDRPLEDLEERNTVFFLRTGPEESIQYQVKCVSASNAWETVEAGCGQILDTFAVDGPGDL